jgi:predicted dehydrogenase
MVNENFRWQAWYRKTKELLDVGALGEPFLARIHRRARMTLPEFDHNQAYLAEMPRLILYEVGVHYLDTFRFLFGEPEAVFARLHHISPQVKGEDAQLIALSYEGLTGVINTSWASVRVPGLDTIKKDGRTVSAPRLEIDGTQGTLALSCDGSLHLHTDNGHQQWQLSEDVLPEYTVAAQQHFIDCLVSGAEFETSGAETLRTMALVYACYQSAEEGRVVNPKELLKL